MLTVAGTGYTGEDGVELAVPAAHAEALWAAVTAAGVVPAGLGARDTLRLEAGLPAARPRAGPGHHHRSRPTSAGSWPGRRARSGGATSLLAEREAGPRRRLRGLVTDGRRPPREGSVVRKDGVEVGEVTSGNFAPELGHGVALAFLPPDAVEGDELVIDVRGTEMPARGGVAARS